MLLAPTILLLGCNPYEVFRVTGFEQENFSNDADILFVIDNSSSMQEEATALATNFDVFINQLTSADGANVPRETLSDAVTNYIRENRGDSLYIDYQLAITTTSVQYDGGATTGIDAGEAGLFIGDVIARDDADPGSAFRQQLVCDSTCWSTIDVPSDPAFVCPTDGTTPALTSVSIEYLDCVCGVDEWKGHCGSGAEMGIEAGLLAICRAVEDPPDECYEFPESSPIGFQAGDEGSNAGFLREGANTLVVVMTDEGDDSPRKDGTGDIEIEPYIDIFSKFPNRTRFAIIGPPYRDDNGDCLDGAYAWQVQRYQNIATATGGTYVDLTNLDDGCAENPFSENLSRLGDLLSQLQSVFPLQSVPDAATIRVWVDDLEVDPSVDTNPDTAPDAVTWTDGWSYDAAYNAVTFHGAALPDYNEDVRIYYRPLAGMPRELPF